MNDVRFRRLIYFFVCFFLSCFNLGVQAQSISLDAVTELSCNNPKGSINLAFSNRGLHTLRIIDIQSSHPAIRVENQVAPLRPGSLGYLKINYDFRQIPQTQVCAIVLQTNDLRKPKVTLLLVYKK